jgi:protein-S-isoprenylcysteine O-methyltransferase Ste14
VHPSGLYLAPVLAELALAVPTFVSLRFVTAPYGRYRRQGWGPTVPARLAWLVMEAPAPVLFAVFYALGAHRAQLVPLLLLGLWELHYVHRAFVYPLLMPAGTRMPASLGLMAIAFNVLNAWINARWVSALGSYPNSWLADPRLLVGAALFLAGLVLNISSDRALRRLRAPGETGYRVPHGGAFEFVSCPNYLGEMAEWTGWALATWSLAGLAFAVYTAANLAPRALAHHRWYRQTFPDYPVRRRALIPYLL